VKVTRPGSDLSREGLAFRLQRLEEGGQTGSAGLASERVADSTAVEPRRVAKPDPAAVAAAAPPSLELEQLQEAWRRSVLPAVEERSIPAGAMLAEARPAKLEGDTLTLEFPPKAGFHREQAEEPKNAGLLGDALYEVTGRRLSVVFAEGADDEPKSKEPERPATEEEIVELVKSTFDAHEVDD
jgi:hypothetical protein